MREQPTIRAYGIAAVSAYPFKEYVYRGDIPLHKDPEVHKSMTHGTASAARLHYLRGEKPCDACRDSERLRWREASKKRKRGDDKSFTREFTPEKCGTNAGHQRHMYYGNTPCGECVDAHRAYQRERRAKRKAAKK